MDSLDKMMQGIASGKSNLAHSLTHEEFVQGIENKTLKYTIIGEASDFLEDKSLAKRAFNFFVVFYWLSPLIVVPIGAYFADNWWLLFGVLFSYLGSMTASMKLIFAPILYCIGEAISRHWHFKDYDDFFILCMLWGYFWTKIAEAYQQEGAKFDLMSKPELYNLAVEKNRIIVTKNIG